MKQGYHVSPLHGDMDQKMRSKVMERFKNRTLQAIVATDVAARGIDVNDITHVINYELPDDPEVYTHRSGRTARAGKSGICMSIVTPREISNIRNIERIVKQRFNKTDIPDGGDVIRKKLFFYLEQIETAVPKADFADTYQQMIHERFEAMEKDELIRRLVWLQLKDAIDAYSESDDLNASFGGNTGGGKSGWKRMFINVGEKDGLNSDRLIQFITESTDVETNMIERVTVREMSSFFNVRQDAAEFIQQSLNSKKYKQRKVRVEEAEQSKGFKSGGGGGSHRGSNSGHRGAGRDFGGGGKRYGSGHSGPQGYTKSKRY